jgi:hypothetical protein
LKRGDARHKVSILDDGGQNGRDLLNVLFRNHFANVTGLGIAAVLVRKPDNLLQQKVPVYWIGRRIDLTHHQAKVTGIPRFEDRVRFSRLAKPNDVKDSHNAHH